LDDSNTFDNTLPPTSNFRKAQVWRRMRYLTFMAAIGGFLFGYDTGVVSGAMLPIKRRFDLSPQQQEVVVSSTVLAAFVSSLYLGAPLNERFGRRWAILFAAAVFGLGSVMLMFAMSYWNLVLGRIVLGLGIGVASLTTPVYIAEVALPSMRGQLVTINTLMITFGQFFAGMVDGVFDELLPETGWRYMLGLAGVPSLIMFVGFLNLPESPRWLAGKGRMQEAKCVLIELRETKREAEVELKEIVEALPPQSTTVSTHHYEKASNNIDQFVDETTSLSSSSSSTSEDPLPYGSNNPLDARNEQQHALTLGCGLMAVQQCSGINTVMYYAASIYEMSGFEEVTAVWLSGFTALAQVAGIAASIFLVDRAGRRTLVLTSLACVTVSLAGLAASFYLSRVTSGHVQHSSGDCQSQPATIWDGATAYCYDCASIPGCGYCSGACVPGNNTGALDGDDLADFCDGDGLEEWQYDACSGDGSVENPYGILSVVFMVLYLLAFGIGMGGMPALTAYGAFGLYGFVALSGLSWLCCTLPETKGLTLEEIEELFRRPGDARGRGSGHEGSNRVDESGEEGQEMKTLVST
ncbi:MAG: hypothetical protein SGILL_009487, partial [Bacillariaceae sp.]